MQSRTMRTDGAMGKIHSFCAWYSFRMSAWIVPESRSRFASALPPQRDVHRQQDPSGRVDGHRHRDPLEVDAVEQMHDIGERVDRHTLAAHFAFGERVIAVVPHQRRHVEIGGKAGLPLVDQVFEAPVRVLGGAEAGDLPHRPKSAAIHRRVRPPRVRILAGQADVGRRRGGRIECRVDALKRKTARCAELRLPLGLSRDKSRHLVLFPGFDLRRECRRVGAVGTAIEFVHAPLLRIASSSRFAAVCGPSVRALSSSSNGDTWPS